MGNTRGSPGGTGQGLQAGVEHEDGFADGLDDALRIPKNFLQLDDAQAHIGQFLPEFCKGSLSAVHRHLLQYPAPLMKQGRIVWREGVRNKREDLSIRPAAAGGTVATGSAPGSAPVPGSKDVPEDQDEDDPRKKMVPPW